MKEVISFVSIIFVLTHALEPVSSFQGFKSPVVHARSYANLKSSISTFKLNGVSEWKEPIQPFDEVVISATSLTTSHSSKSFDVLAVASYFGATTLQWTLIVAFLHAVQIGVIKNIPSTLSLKPMISQTIVFLTMLFLSLRSRIFSPLDNTRPKPTNEEPIFKERLRPSWQPPPKAFPIIWSTISLLRGISAVIVFNSKNTLISPPIFAFMLHLSIGDTWNTVNNVEKRLGTAFLGSLFVLASVLYTTFLYYKANPIAAAVLFPSCIWLTIANVLVYSIWRLNYDRFDKPSLLPSKEEGPPSNWKFPFFK